MSRPGRAGGITTSPRHRGGDQAAPLGPRALPGHPHAGAAARHARRPAGGLPYLVTFHTGGHSSRLRNAIRATQWRLAAPLLRNAAALVAVSRFEAATLTRDARLGDKRVVVIRNGETLPSPPPGTVAVPGRIVSSGRLEPYKGHHRVIEALPHVMRDVPEAHLLIVEAVRTRLICTGMRAVSEFPAG